MYKYKNTLGLFNKHFNLMPQEIIPRSWLMSLSFKLKKNNSYFKQ